MPEAVQVLDRCRNRYNITKENPSRWEVAEVQALVDSGKGYSIEWNAEVHRFDIREEQL